MLIPDYQGAALEAVLEARPAVLNHNIETVRRVFPHVRAKGNYDASLEVLRQAGGLAPGIPTKSGMMVGLGEEWHEILETMDDLRNAGVELLTVGQYLRPSPKHVPLSRHYTPKEFSSLREEGISRGFRHVASGPLVRSSYHADEQADAAERVLSAP